MTKSCVYKRLGVNVRTELYRRAGQTVYLYSMIVYLCKKTVRIWYAYINTDNGYESAMLFTMMAMVFIRA